MTDPSTDLAVAKRVVVDAPRDRAFRLFAEQFARWWPLATHHIGAETPVEVIAEPRPGGRWFERAADGTECDWGRVKVWDPPARVVFVWELNAEWRHDPSVQTEVDVRFTADGPERTIVELEHRGLAAYGERAEELQSILGSDGGWSGLLQSFAEAVKG